MNTQLQITFRDDLQESRGKSKTFGKVPFFCIVAHPGDMRVLFNADPTQISMGLMLSSPNSCHFADANFTLLGIDLHS